MPEDLGDTPAIGTLTYKPSPALRETQSGIDPTELPRLLANAMPEGSWVAVTMRKPSNRERKFYTPWLGNRMGTAVPTHHSTSLTAVLVSITAGGASKEEVTSLLSQVTAGLPGFDLDSGLKFAPSRHALVLGLPAGLVLAAAALFGLPQLPAEHGLPFPETSPRSSTASRRWLPFSDWQHWPAASPPRHEALQSPHAACGTAPAEGTVHPRHTETLLFDLRLGI